MALCKFPIYLAKAGGIVPCGQCFTCRLNKARFWTFRLMMEAKLHERTFWTTITYNDEFLPVDAYDIRTGRVTGSHPLGTLFPAHIELFIKRVRKAIAPNKIRYFLVGEYGETTFRPHYHVLFFGAGEEILRTLELCWTDPKSKRVMGFIDREYCGPVTSQNARYTVGYTLKKLTKIGDDRLEGRHPEFTSHSLGNIS